jgi:hypothetical protein
VQRPFLAITCGLVPTPAHAGLLGLALAPFAGGAQGTESDSRTRALATIAATRGEHIRDDLMQTCASSLSSPGEVVDALDRAGIAARRRFYATFHEGGTSRVSAMRTPVSATRTKLRTPLSVRDAAPDPEDATLKANIPLALRPGDELAAWMQAHRTEGAMQDARRSWRRRSLRGSDSWSALRSRAGVPHELERDAAAL